MSKSIPVVAVCLLLLVSSADAHGILTKPASRAAAALHGNGDASMQHGGLCPTNGGGCSGGGCVSNNACAWYGLYTVPRNVSVWNPTLPDAFRTWHNYEPYTYQTIVEATPGVLISKPWLAPGSRAITTPCGTSDNGTSMLDLPSTPGAVWKRGGTAEVAWGVSANHGGGYAYRLCPVGRGATEACFQQNHLQFEGGSSWVQYGNDEAGRIPFASQTLDIGTVPKGSQWNKNPIPACVRTSAGCPSCFYSKFHPDCSIKNQTCSSSCKFGMCQPKCAGACAHSPKISAGCVGENFNGTQFPERVPGVSGGTVGSWPGVLSAQQPSNTVGANYSIVDRVKVPAALKPGKYLLSWRWDVEGSAEIFAQCADVKVV